MGTLVLLSFYIKKEMVGWSRFALHRVNNCLFNNAFRLCSRQHNIGHPQTIRLCSTENKDPKILSRKDQLKRAVSQYGSTVIVFHVGISLVSLGFFYLVVSSGIDVAPLVEKIPYVGDQFKASTVAAGASTFVIAYAVHKVFAPVRISITLTSVPFIVRYLRSKGVL